LYIIFAVHQLFKLGLTLFHRLWLFQFKFVDPRFFFLDPLFLCIISSLPCIHPSCKMKEQEFQPLVQVAPCHTVLIQITHVKLHTFLELEETAVVAIIFRCKSTFGVNDLGAHLIQKFAIVTNDDHGYVLVS